MRLRVLLDECVPRRLRADLRDHEVRTVQEEGWASLKNGELLRAAADRFDVLLTVDRSIPFQQNLRGLEIGVLAMVVASNRLGARWWTNTNKAALEGLLGLPTHVGPPMKIQFKNLLLKRL